MKTLLIFALHVLILSSRSIWGVDFGVTNNADSGSGSLRQAIIDLNASASSETSTITFDPGLGRISLLSDLPAIEVEGVFTTATGDSLIIDGGVKLFSALNRSFNINVSPSSSLALLGTLDSGSLMRLGSGELILEGSNNYTEGTTISGGLLTLYRTGTLAPTGKVAINSGGILDISSIGADSQTISGLSGSEGEIVLGEKTLIIESVLSTVYRGVISGAGSVIKQGPQMLILMGDNTYSGRTEVREGVLQGNTASLQGDIINDASLIFDQISSSEYTGVISGSGTLTKQNTGLLILSNANTYSGGTRISGGILQGNTTSLQGDIINDASLIFDQISSGQYVGVISGSGNVVKKNAGTLILSNANTYSGGTTVIEGILQGNATSLQGDIANDALVVFDQVDTGTYNGMISGTGAVIKQNTGTLFLQGSNHVGGTTINAGTLALLGRLPDIGSVTVNAGVFDISALSASSQTIYNLSGIGGEVVLGENTLIAGSLDDTMYAGVISGAGSFTKDGSGTLTLSAANTYTGATTILSGPLILSGNGSLATNNPVILSGADSIFDITGANGACSIGSLDGVMGSQVLLGANTLTIEGSNDASYAGVISGTGSLIKQGSGKVILAGANTYSGGTLVGAGSLQGSTDSLQGNILNNASIVFDQAYTGTYDGILSGIGAINKQNIGTVVFTSPNTYSGGTMITLGTLALSGSGAICPTGTVIINVGNFDISNITASSQTIGSLIGGGNIFLGEKTLIIATENDTSYVGVVSGAGSLIKQGGGTLTLGETNTYSGGTTINAGTLVLSGSGKLSSIGAVTINAGSFDISNIADSSQTIGDLSGMGGELILGDKTLIQEAFNYTSYAGTIQGSGALIKQGLGTLILTGDNDYSGGTTVNAGVLQGDTNSLQGNILSDAQLVFNQISSGTYEGIISGGGNLVKQGIGMLTPMLSLIN
ncbi:autotransporter-associated beta strand repeat-containing protein [Candidatus Rhabdochlamydia sp. T3358]|uniref:autotransporter-associated beta strand repeat-containing protein n=1 Tax=Candidatus Rhabdochlamydia sp. T3358 TaxID=2099795 RepID=UPI0010B8DF23|nr:autotransporter-associated beta strand repeat-containing protein [Candidatus Rhabdochlamydia sp. T3358]VHO03253.1 Autotransporter-associated beta strand repeat protein [Candidatus Rhabdochlamydia sp. T3358]